VSMPDAFADICKIVYRLCTELPRFFWLIWSLQVTA
jgi:hypothetical protein